MFEKIKSHFLLIMLVIIATGLYFFYLKIQPHLNHDFSALFDANKYMEVYRYFNGEKASYEVAFPVNTRIAVPWLASKMPFGNPIPNFLMINYLFLILSVISIYYLWKQFDLTPGYMLVGFFWLLIHWVGIIRLNIFDPVTVDVPLFFFQTLLMLIILQRRFLWLLILAPIATLQKESFIGLLIITFLTGIYVFWINKELKKRELILLFMAVILSVLTRKMADFYFPPQDEGKSSLLILLFHARETILNPFRLVRWLIGLFTAFGPLLILAIWHKTLHKKLGDGNKFLITLSLTYLGFSLLGGGDFARLTFLGFPFIMTWILVSIKDIRGFLFMIAFIMGLPLMKLFRNIPDPSTAGWDRFYNFYPEFANPVIVILWLGYGILCLLAFRTIHKKLSMLP